MLKTLVLLGFGGHGAVVLDAARAAGWHVLAVCDPALMSAPGLELRQEDELRPVRPIANGVGSIEPRAQLAARMRERGFAWATIIDPAAVVAPDAEIGPGAQILAGAIVQPGARIGADAIVNVGARVCHHTSIGPGAHIGPGAILCGNVSVGAETLIGAGAVVTPGIAIGAHQLVKAGARLSLCLGRAYATRPVARSNR